MCGRYALGAAHIDFLEGLQEQYARLFPGRRGGDGEGRVRGGGPQRLRGGGGGGDHCDAAGTKDQGDAAETKDQGGVAQADADAEVKPSPDELPAKVRPTQPVAKSFGITWEREQDFWPRHVLYNIAPRQRAPVVRRNPATGEAMIETMQWGLIPHWTKFPPTGPLNTINARSESLIDPSSGGLWHALKAHKRCVIPAQGYYEWQKKGTTKVAHFTRLPLHDGQTAAAPPLLFFAGLWDTVHYAEPVPSRFVPEEGDNREPYPTGNPVPLATFTILTTAPGPDIAWLHDRMPCVLTDEDEIARWLDLGEVHGWEEGKGGTADLLHSFKGLASYAVVPEVGKIGRSEANYILPVAERKDGIKSFFQKATVKADKKAGPTGKAEPTGKTEPPRAPAPASPQTPRKEDIKASPQKRKLSLVAAKAGPKSEIKSETPASQDVVVIDDDEDESPLPSSSQPRSTPKRKREEKQGGGRPTKVVRPAKEETKAQPSIKSFFKSPKKA